MKDGGVAKEMTAGTITVIILLGVLKLINAESGITCQQGPGVRAGGTYGTIFTLGDVLCPLQNTLKFLAINEQAV